MVEIVPHNLMTLLVLVHHAANQTGLVVAVQEFF